MNGVMTTITAVAVCQCKRVENIDEHAQAIVYFIEETSLRCWCHCVRAHTHADTMFGASFSSLLFRLTLNQYYFIWSCELFTWYQVIYVSWHVCIVCLYYHEYLTSLTVFFYNSQTLSFNWSKIQKFMKQRQVFSGVCTLYAMCYCYSYTMRMPLFVPLTLFGCFYSCSLCMSSLGFTLRFLTMSVLFDGCVFDKMTLARSNWKHIGLIKWRWNWILPHTPTHPHAKKSIREIVLNSFTRSNKNQTKLVFAWFGGITVALFFSCCFRALCAVVWNFQIVSKPRSSSRTLQTFSYKNSTRMTNEGKNRRPTNDWRSEKKIHRNEGRTKTELGFIKITSQKRKTFVNAIHINALSHERTREKYTVLYNVRTCVYADV